MEPAGRAVRGHAPLGSGESFRENVTRQEAAEATGLVAGISFRRRGTGYLSVRRTRNLGQVLPADAEADKIRLGLRWRWEATGGFALLVGLGPGLSLRG